MMKLSERRAYLDRMRKNQQASLCPACMKKTRHLTVPGKKGGTDVVCEYCGKTVRYGTSLTPYIPVRILNDGKVVNA